MNPTINNELNLFNAYSVSNYFKMFLSLFNILRGIEKITLIKIIVNKENTNIIMNILSILKKFLKCFDQCIK